MNEVCKHCGDEIYKSLSDPKIWYHRISKGRSCFKLYAEPKEKEIQSNIKCVNCDRAIYKTRNSFIPHEYWYHCDNKMRSCGLNIRPAVATPRQEEVVSQKPNTVNVCQKHYIQFSTHEQCDICKLTASSQELAAAQQKQTMKCGHHVSLQFELSSGESYCELCYRFDCMQQAEQRVTELERKLDVTQKNYTEAWNVLCSIGFYLGVVTPENNLRLHEVVKTRLEKTRFEEIKQKAISIAEAETKGGTRNDFAIGYKAAAENITSNLRQYLEDIISTQEKKES